MNRRQMRPHVPTVAVITLLALFPFEPLPASVVELSCAKCTTPVYKVSATREIPNGDYVHETNPPCATLDVQGKAGLWGDLERYAAGSPETIALPADFAGPLLRPNTEELLQRAKGVRIEGDLGRWLSATTKPIAACVALVVAIPRGASIRGITYEAAEAGTTDAVSGEAAYRAWQPCTPNGGCLEGWASFERAREFEAPSGVTLVATLYKNWAHNRYRRARMNVVFAPPPGWKPPRDPVAHLELRFPSASSVAGSPEALEELVRVASQAPPIELLLAPGLPFNSRLVRFFGFQGPDLGRIAARLRQAVYELNHALRGWSPEQFDQVVEQGKGSVLVPALPSYSPQTQPLTFLNVASDVWYAADRLDATRVFDQDGPRWLPPLDRGLDEVVRYRATPGTSLDNEDRFLHIEYTNSALLDEERLSTFDASPFVVESGEVNLELAASGDDATDQVDAASTEGFALEVAGLLHDARRQTRLYVLDTGFPSLGDQDRAFVWLRSVLALQGGAAPAAAVAAECPFESLQGQQRHAEDIKKALGPFEAADTGDRVSVIYLPVSRSQCSADAFLERLVAFSAKRRFKLDVAAPSFDLRAHAHSLIQALPKPDPAAKDVRTDRLILDSYLDAFDALQNQGDADDGYVLSTSWLAEAKLVGSYGSPQRGMLLAAVGNRSSFQIFDGRIEVEFARRALARERVIAVTAHASQGPCIASDTAARPGLHPLLLSFDGTVAGVGCKTSFATPRAAWLLAGIEATRVSQQGQGWPAWFREVVAGATRPGESRIDWSRLVSFKSN